MVHAPYTVVCRKQKTRNDKELGNSSANEVIGEAFRLMDKHDTIPKAKIDLLRQEIQTGLKSAAATDWNPEAIKGTSITGKERRSSQKNRNSFAAGLSRLVSSMQ
jgi:hypothetical protein